MHGNASVIYGIGAQKAGTTWLFDWLQGCEDIHAARNVPDDPDSARKEIHYFDVKYVPQMRNWYAKQVKEFCAKAGRLETVPAATRAGQIMKLRGELDWLDMSSGEADDHSRYVAYLHRGYAGQRYVLDITPAYALLDAAGFGTMLSVAPEARFIYILRDPVDRLWSGIRYALRHDRDLTEENFEAICRNKINNALSRLSDHKANRQNYRMTLEQLFEVVPRDRVLLLFYEELFCDATVERLSGFLGVELNPPSFGSRKNESRSAELPQELIAQAAAHFRGQYDFVSEFFDGDIPTLWKERMALTG